MNLEERQDDYDEPLDNENAVEIKNSYFLWSVSEFYLKHLFLYFSSISLKIIYKCCIKKKEKILHVFKFLKII